MSRIPAIVSFGGLIMVASAVQAVTVQTFDNWLPDSVYESWPNGNLIEGATGFGIQATGFGGGYANVGDPFVIDGTGANTIQLLATVNSGTAGFVVTLGDTSLREWNYTWFGKTPGNGINGTNDYVLTQNIADFTFRGGPLGQLDLANLDFIHIQVDPGAGNLTTPYDVTYNDLSVITASANLHWNNLGAPSPNDGTTWDTLRFNWNNGNAPAKFHAGDTVAFTDSNNGHSTVTINSVFAPGSTLVNSSLAYVFNGTGGIGGAGGLTVSGTGSLTLNTTNNTYGAETIVNSGATLNVNGSLPATTALNASGAVNFAANTTAGIAARTLGPVTLAAGGKVTVAASATTAQRTVLVTSGLSFGGTAAAPEGILDLTSNDMIVKGGTATTIRGQLKAGLAGTSGIIWAPGATGNRRPGYKAITAAGTFDGQAVAAGDVVVKYTIFGDADLSGDVGFQDLVSLAQNYNFTNTVWGTGDFDYSGVTDFNDLVGLAQNYNLSLSLDEQSQLGSDFAADWALAQSLVPEPGVLSVVGLAGMVLSRRRR